MSQKLSLAAVNSLSSSDFESIFINVVECWPDAADSVFKSTIPAESFIVLLAAFDNYLAGLDGNSKLRILQYHPDLAGKLASEGNLTTESTQEQASAGLNNLNDAELIELRTLNQLYKDKFGFPFVICVRQTNKIEAIIAGLKERLEHTRDIELFTGIEEVKKICRLRVCQLIDF